MKLRSENGCEDIKKAEKADSVKFPLFYFTPL